MVFPTTPDEPYEGTDLDHADVVKPGGLLESAVATVKPGLVVIDSLTNATGRDLCSQSQMKPLKTPLVRLVQNYRTSIGLSLHLSKEAQVLGRRIEGLTRTLLHLECPDPKQPGRLRLWVEKSYSKKTPAGRDHDRQGNTYDTNPPERAQSDSMGRPAEARRKAHQFILEALTQQNDPIGIELSSRWEQTGGTARTFWRAVRTLVASGGLATDGGKGTGKQMMLHLIAGSASQADARVAASA